MEYITQPEIDTPVNNLAETEAVLIENARSLNAIYNRLQELSDRLFGPAPSVVGQGDSPRADGALDRLRDVANLQKQQISDILRVFAKLEQGLETVPATYGPEPKPDSSTNAEILGTSNHHRPQSC